MHQHRKSRTHFQIADVATVAIQTNINCRERFVPTDGSKCLLLNGDFGTSPFYWQLSENLVPSLL